MDQKESLRTSASLMLLSLIEKKDMYGYEIIETLRHASKNIFDLKEGTLYPMLHRLEKQGFLKSYNQKTESGPNRKYYTLTDKGAKQLVEEKEAWSIFSGAINAVVRFGL